MSPIELEKSRWDRRNGGSLVSQSCGANQRLGLRRTNAHEIGNDLSNAPSRAVSSFQTDSGSSLRCLAMDRTMKKGEDIPERELRVARSLVHVTEQASGSRESIARRHSGDATSAQGRLGEMDWKDAVAANHLDPGQVLINQGKLTEGEEELRKVFRP